MSGNKQELVARTITCQKPQFYFLSPRTRDLLVSRKTMQRHFFSILHHLSTFNSCSATVVVFVLLRNSSSTAIVIHSVNKRLLRNRPGRGSCDLSQLLSRKITRGIHSCKPAAQSDYVWMQRRVLYWEIAASRSKCCLYEV